MAEIFLYFHIENSQLGCPGLYFVKQGMGEWQWPCSWFAEFSSKQNFMTPIKVQIKSALLTTFSSGNKQGQLQFHHTVNKLSLYTVWKFQDFSVTQILREINFGVSRISKVAVFAILGALNFISLVILHLQKRQKFKNIKIQIH